MVFWQVAHQFLKACRLDIPSGVLKQKMLSNINYPSIVALTDILDEFNLEYHVFQITEKELTKDFYPFLSYVKKGEHGDFKIIRSAKMLTESFLEQWTGIALVILSNEDYNINFKQLLQQVKHGKRKRTLLIALFTVALISLYGVHFNLFASLFSVFSLAGVYFSTLSVLQESGIGNNICRQDNYRDCSTITSPIKIFGNIGLADIGLIYFVYSFLLVFLASAMDIAAIALSLSILPAILGIPVIGFSLYLQKRQNTWCKICLFTNLVLLLQFLLIGLFFHFADPVISTIIYVPAIISITIAISWILVKSAFTSYILHEQKSILYDKGQLNPQLFLAFLQLQRNIPVAIREDEIISGNPEGSLKIILLIDPFCSVCTNTYQWAKSLASAHPEEICLITRFSIYFKNKDNSAHQIVESIVIASKSDHILNSEAVEMWFKDPSLNSYNKLYNLQEEPITKFSLAHAKWCKEVDISYSPAIFLNGFLVPEGYNTDHLKIIIPQILRELMDLKIHI